MGETSAVGTSGIADRADPVRKYRTPHCAFCLSMSAAAKCAIWSSFAFLKAGGRRRAQHTNRASEGFRTYEPPGRGARPGGEAAGRQPLSCGKHLLEMFETRRQPAFERIVPVERQADDPPRHGHHLHRVQCGDDPFERSAAPCRSFGMSTSLLPARCQERGKSPEPKNFQRAVSPRFRPPPPGCRQSRA